MTKHTILLLAANPRNSWDSAFAEEGAAIHSELKRSSCREWLELETRWASEPLDLLRALRELKPTVVHFSGCGGRAGLWFPATNGDARVVPSAAIAQAFEAAGASVRLIVMSACDSEPSAEALLPHIDCIVSISHVIDYEMVRAFVIGFYGALGEYESVEAAYQHGNAAISLMGLSDVQRPRLWVRKGIDARKLILVAAPAQHMSSPCSHPAMPPRSLGDVECPEGRNSHLTEVSSHETASQHEFERVARKRRRQRVALAMTPVLGTLLAFAAWKQQSRIQNPIAIVVSPVRAIHEHSSSEWPGEQTESPTALHPLWRTALAADARGDTGAAEKILRTTKGTEYPWVNAYHQAVVAERANDLIAAEASLRSSIENVESMRAGAALGLRPWVLWHRREPYDALFVLLAKQHKDVAALTVAEQLHARTWLDALATSGNLRVRSVLGIAPTVEPLSSRTLLSMLGDREVLIYVEARGALWRLHIDAGEVVELTQVPAAAKTLLTRWRQSYNDKDIAEQLGVMLIPFGITASARPLYVVTPADLAELPFAALRRSHHYLIDDRPLVRLSGLAELRCNSGSVPVGAPVLIADSRSDLPQARSEVTYAARITKGAAFFGIDATIDQVERASHAPLLHLSVHSDSGSLALADGELSPNTIRDLGIAPSMVVLSSCGSAAGHDPEGWEALSSAFLAAGTRTVVATLHSVTDDDATLLMRAFYEAGGNVHPAAALAAAQRRVARYPEVRPMTWAGFTVWGHAEPSECHDEQPL